MAFDAHACIFLYTLLFVSTHINNQTWRFQYLRMRKTKRIHSNLLKGTQNNIKSTFSKKLVNIIGL